MFTQLFMIHDYPLVVNDENGKAKLLSVPINRI